MTRMTELAKKKAKDVDSLEEVKDNLFLVSEKSKPERIQVFLDLRNGFSYYGYQEGEVIKDLNMPTYIKRIRSLYMAKGCQTLDSFIS